MKINSNISLLHYNTFGIDVLCSNFYEYESVDDLKSLFDKSIFNSKWLSIGGGSNMLFLNDFNGSILHSAIKDIEIIEDNDETFLVRVGSGVLWDDFVAWCVDRDLGGVENLSYIPGCVGASPVQNIGAYGVEAKDVIDSVEFFDTTIGRCAVLTNSELSFSYRSSIFKSNPHWIVTNVLFRLTKAPYHQICLTYGNLQSVIDKEGLKPTLKTIREVVINVRKSKLPEPSEIGSAGSFFKNPIVSDLKFLEIRKEYPSMPFYEMEEGRIKIPAGWLIEQCGWKGKRFGEVGVYEKQALVLVNYGGAKGSQVEKLSADICASVKDKFDIEIEPEVCFVY